MTRLLGIDLGERRIGLAIADARRLRPVRWPRSARPAVDARRRRHRRRIVARAGHRRDRRRPAARGSGGEGAQARRHPAVGDAVAALIGLPVIVRDERLTSHLAEQRLGPMPRGRSGGPPTQTQRDAYRARVDREAAAIILQDELDARAAAGAVHGDRARTTAPADRRATIARRILRRGDSDEAGDRPMPREATGRRPAAAAPAGGQRQRARGERAAAASPASLAVPALRARPRGGRPRRRC